MTFEYNLQIGHLKNVKHIYQYMGFFLFYCKRQIQTFLDLYYNK